MKRLFNLLFKLLYILNSLQLFSLDKENKIRKENRCLIVVERKHRSDVVMEKCSTNDGIRVDYFKVQIFFSYIGLFNIYQIMIINKFKAN